MCSLENKMLCGKIRFLFFFLQLRILICFKKRTYLTQNSRLYTFHPLYTNNFKYLYLFEKIVTNMHWFWKIVGDAVKFPQRTAIYFSLKKMTTIFHYAFQTNKKDRHKVRKGIVYIGKANYDSATHI